MSGVERAYYQDRAVQERAMARETSDPMIAAIHDELADHYFVWANLTEDEFAAFSDEARWIPASVDDADNFRRTRRSSPA